MDMTSHSDLVDCFNTAMDRLGPFEPRPRLAVAVSGGADSMALALLARHWASRAGGHVFALTIDHGLRPEAGDEAALTLCRLAALGIEGRRLTVTGLARGHALAERAREARYRLLLEACSGEGLTHLLLGHHRSDQAETVMMRALSSSGMRGLAAMPALTETRSVRLMRPLLNVAPGRLRAFLTSHGVTWIEDPSNHDPSALRARLRAARADPDGTAEGTMAVANAARAAGTHRSRQDDALAEVLATRAAIHPEGYAILTPGTIEPGALAMLLRTIAGAAHAPPLHLVATLARCLCPATLWGVRILAAGRLGPGWMVVRERRAMAGAVEAHPGAIWDGRFRLAARPPPQETLTLGALGADSVRFRDRKGPPAAVLHGLPAVRRRETVLAVPHLGVGDPRWTVLFDPRNRAAGAPFVFG